MSNSSEMEFSDNSTSESMASTSGYSPVQQVPELPGGSGPKLNILIQPQGQFRFRYESDNKMGSHGCIPGVDEGRNKTSRTYPTVELVNYSGKAVITCELIQKNSEDIHPHEITSNKNNQNDIELPNKKGYKACFDDLKIISMLKGEVLNFVNNKYRRKLNGLNARQAKKKRKEIANTIDLDVVRLKFTAMDYESKKVLCSAISEPINNEKSVKTNELRICKFSRWCGCAKGGDSVYMFVEKVDKKNIQIRFYELDENNEVVWEDFGRFSECDVHHQYAIYFTTPPYRGPTIKREVTVCMQLRRRTNGTTSEPKKFVYKNNLIYMKRGPSSNNNGIIKKRKIEDTELMQSYYGREDDRPPQIGTPLIQNNVAPTPEIFYQGQCSLGNDGSYALTIQPADPLQLQGLITDAVISENNNENNFCILPTPVENTLTPDESCFIDEIIKNNLNEAHPPLPGDPMFPQNPVSNPNVMNMLQQDIYELQHQPQDGDDFFNIDFNMDEYEHQLGFVEEDVLENENNNCQYISDSAVKIIDKVRQEADEDYSDESLSSGKIMKSIEKVKEEAGYISNEEYSDESLSSSKVMKLIKELSKLVKEENKGRRLIEEKLEQLLDLRLPNGDTYLHYLLVNNIKLFLHMVEVLSSFDIEHLYVTGDNQRNILHLAAMLDLASIVSLLINYGCDPMIEDEEGNNAFHFAAMNDSSRCLEAMLSNALRCGLEIDLDAYNFEKQTPLHLAVIFGCADSVDFLSRRGASPHLRDCEGRAPLHLAAYGAHPHVAKRLLRHVSMDHIDDIDSRGLTALQIACEVNDICSNTLEIIKLLLQKEANPMKCESGTRSALELARNRPQVWKVFKDFENTDESDDEYYSADEACS